MSWHLVRSRLPLLRIALVLAAMLGLCAAQASADEVVDLRLPQEQGIPTEPRGDKKADTPRGETAKPKPPQRPEDQPEEEADEDQDDDDAEEEEEPLVTDRPDFTESSSVVGAGRVQFEMGYTFVHNDDHGVLTHAHSFPEILCRIGISENVELRIAWNYLAEREDDFGDLSSIDGAEDLELGVKLALTEQHHWFPETAMILAITAPTGRREFSNDEVTFGMALLYGWELPCDFSLGGSTVYANPAEHATVALAPLGDAEFFDRHNLFAQSVTLGVPLLGDWWRMYVEYFGIFTAGRSSDVPQNYLNGGFTWLLTNDLQLDWRVGAGLNHSADDFFTGAGVAWRY